MIAGANRIPKNPRRSRARRTSSVLRQRAERVLTREIAFVPNPSFREFDADPAWRRELESDIPHSGPDLFDAPLGGRIRMPAHLERLCAAPLLTPEQERDLFCRMNYLKYRANSLRVTLSAKRPNERKLNKIDQLLGRASAVRNQIVHANIRLVVSIVKQFADERNSFDDLLSEGISCLIKAVEKFDFDRGFRFSTYATRAVRREVFRLVQRQFRDRVRFATGSSDALTKQLTTETSPERSETSWNELHQSIGTLMGALDQREKFIVQARYGFHDLGEKPTFQHLGRLLGVSKERVRQLEQRALGKLREQADGLRLESSF
jgi:RNA polymerase primary sigma factor